MSQCTYIPKDTVFIYRDLYGTLILESYIHLPYYTIYINNYWHDKIQCGTIRMINTLYPKQHFFEIKYEPYETN